MGDASIQWGAVESSLSYWGGIFAFSQAGAREFPWKRRSYTPFSSRIHTIFPNPLARGVRASRSVTGWSASPRWALANLTVSEGERWITELTDGELRGVFALAEEGP
jgi:hypothetical protein